MTPANTEPLGQCFDPGLIERPLFDQPQRAIDRRASAAPRRVIVETESNGSSVITTPV